MSGSLRSQPLVDCVKMNQLRQEVVGIWEVLGNGGSSFYRRCKLCYLPSLPCPTPHPPHPSWASVLHSPLCLPLRSILPRGLAPMTLLAHLQVIKQGLPKSRTSVFNPPPPGVEFLALTHLLPTRNERKGQSDGGGLPGR